MSRLKNPPKEMCLIRTKDGSWLPFQPPPKEVNLLEICGLEIAYYDLRQETGQKPNNQPKKREKCKKEPKTDAAEAPQGEIQPVIRIPAEYNAPQGKPDTQKTKPQRKGRKPKAQSVRHRPDVKVEPKYAYI